MTGINLHTGIEVQHQQGATKKDLTKSISRFIFGDVQTQRGSSMTLVLEDLHLVDVRSIRTALM